MTAAEERLVAAEERLAQGDEAGVHDILASVRLLPDLIGDSERTTRVYLALVRLHRALHQHHSMRIVAPDPEPEPEPEPEPAPLAELESGSARRSIKVAPQPHATTQPDPCPPGVGGTLAAATHVVPRLKLGESLLVHDAGSGPRTRSSRRLSSRRSLESTRGTPSNTDRSLRSVRLHVQDDTVRPPAVYRPAEQHSTGFEPTAGRQLQLLAARAAGVFMARHTAGIVSNLRDQHAPTARQPVRRPLRRRRSPLWRSQHRIVELMDSVVKDALEHSHGGARCALDVDVVQLPVNALVADLMSTAQPVFADKDVQVVPGDYRAALLRLCCRISSVVDIWNVLHHAAANGVRSLDAAAFVSKEAQLNRHEVAAVLPGGTTAVDTMPVRPAGSVTAKACINPRRDRVILRLGRILKGLVYADTMDRHRVSHCLSLLADYIKVCPTRAGHAVESTISSLRHLSGRTLTGPGFDLSVHLSSVDVVHCLLAVTDSMMEPRDWFVTEANLSSWIGAYCCWTLSTNLSNSSFTVEQMQSQAIRYITRCVRACKQRCVDGKLALSAADGALGGALPKYITSILTHDYTTGLSTGCAQAAAALGLISELATTPQQRDLLEEDNTSAAMCCACTVFLRAYFQPAQGVEKQALCCAAIETMLQVLQGKFSRRAMEQVEQLRLVEILVGELSSEHLSHQSDSAPHFSATTSAVREQEREDTQVDEIDDEVTQTYETESDDEAYGSALSDSLDSRYSGGDGDSYSFSEGLGLTAQPKVAMPSLHLPAPLAMPRSDGAPVQGTADLSKPKVQAARAPLQSMEPEVGAAVSRAGIDLADTSLSFDRQIYESDELHLLILQLVMALVTTSDGLLSPAYWSRTPAAEGKPNLHNLLYDHLNHARNRHLISELEKRVMATPSAEAGTCLLKLLCASLFKGSSYADRTRLASGAYATVYRCSITSTHLDVSQAPTHAPLDPQVAALKVIDRSSSANHFCPLPDVFSEIRVLMRLHGCEGACQLMDYGVGPDSYYIALKCYTTSLRKWRLHQDTRALETAHDQDQRLLYLRIYRRILDVTDTLAARNIIHFDIKCDNVLMSPAENVDLADFWAPTPPAVAQYEVVLADFGVGKLVGQSETEGMHTTRNRGTECIKSPEMILSDRFALQLVGPC